MCIIDVYFQEAFPARFKGIHYVHEPTFFDVVFTIVRQFLKEKMLKRVSLHCVHVCVVYVCVCVCANNLMGVCVHEYVHVCIVCVYVCE